jgi:hypothetical protein
MNAIDRSLTTAVGGCPYHDRDDPGNIELDWLEDQLEAYRERNMQVWVVIYLFISD